MTEKILHLHPRRGRKGAACGSANAPFRDPQRADPAAFSTGIHPLLPCGMEPHPTGQGVIYAGSACGKQPAAYRKYEVRITKYKVKSSRAHTRVIQTHFPKSRAENVGASLFSIDFQ